MVAREKIEGDVVGGEVGVSSGGAVVLGDLEVGRAVVWVRRYCLDYYRH